MDHFTIIIDLNKPVKELFDAVHKKKRNNIRRAVKRGVSFKQLSGSAEIETAIDLIQSTYRRIRLLWSSAFITGKCYQFFS